MDEDDPAAAAAAGGGGGAITAHQPPSPLLVQDAPLDPAAASTVQYSTVQYTPTGADTGVLMTAISPAVLPIDPSIDMTGCGGSLPALHAVNWMPSWSTSIDHH